MTSVVRSQILNFVAAFITFSLTFTFVAFRQPKDLQPAAYGHIQTLTNLIYNWSPVMWWGDKSVPDQPGSRHAGKSLCLLLGS